MRTWVQAETKTSEDPPSEAWIRDEHGGGVGRLDCFMNTKDAYTGLGACVCVCGWVGELMGGWVGGGVTHIHIYTHTHTHTHTHIGHRVPGESPYKGPVQDWRYYVGHALTDAEIRSIAQASQDMAGSMLRTCTLPEANILKSTLHSDFAVSLV